MIRADSSLGSLALQSMCSLNDSCGQAELSKCSHNAALTTAGWHFHLVWTPMLKCNQSQESDVKCDERDSWNNTKGQTTGRCTRGKQGQVSCSSHYQTITHTFKTACWKYIQYETITEDGSREGRRLCVCSFCERERSLIYLFGRRRSRFLKCSPPQI